MTATSSIALALYELFEFFVGSEALKSVRWDQYELALADVNLGDLDDAIGELRKHHGFRNIPLPAEIRRYVDEAKRKRIAALIEAERPKIDPNEGELKTITVKGIGSLKLRVLPDDHPSLQRFYCLLCKDTGWSEVPADPGAQMTVRRCDCWRINPEIQKERERSARYVKERNER